MSRKDGVLDLVVKAVPYRDIFSGVKPEEYRADKEGKGLWEQRLMYPGAVARIELFGCAFSRDFRPYHTARISLGYASDRPSHLRKIRGIRWGAPNPAWCYGIVTAEKCFIIEFGGILA